MPWVTDDTLKWASKGSVPEWYFPVIPVQSEKLLAPDGRPVFECYRGI